MRQYRILYKRGVGGKFRALEKFVHAPIYQRPELDGAIMLMRDRPYLEGLALRFGEEQFNVVSFNQEAEAPNSFLFNDEDKLTINEPVDAAATLEAAGLNA